MSGERLSTIRERIKIAAGALDVDASAVMALDDAEFGQWGGLIPWIEESLPGAPPRDAEARDHQEREAKRD